MAYELRLSDALAAAWVADVRYFDAARSYGLAEALLLGVEARSGTERRLGESTCSLSALNLSGARGTWTDLGQRSFGFLIRAIHPETVQPARRRGTPRRPARMS
jgi:hypothetical protein